jgi:hypothetical protein
MWTVIRIVDHGGPEPDDLGTALADHYLGIDSVALGFGHLLASLIHGEAVGEDGVIGRSAARSGAFQQRRLEPAAMLIGAFEVEVGRPLRMGPVLQGEGVGGATVEPDIQDVLDLFETLGIVVAKEIGVRAVEPGVGTFLCDQIDDAAVDRVVVQRLAGFLIDEHGERRAPRTLAADQPVGAAFHHRADTVLAAGGIEFGRLDSLQCGFAQGVAVVGLVLQRLVHADEPLGRVTENDGRAGPPGMRIAVLQPPACQQVSRLD